MLIQDIHKMYVIMHLVFEYLIKKLFCAEQTFLILFQILVEIRKLLKMPKMSDLIWGGRVLDLHIPLSVNIMNII